MSYAVITTRVDSQTKKQAAHVAAKLGMPLSAVIKAFLKQFIRTKTLNLSSDDEEPTPALLRDLAKSERDKQAGRVLSFQTPAEALAYLDKELEHEKKRK